MSSSRRSGAGRVLLRMFAALALALLCMVGLGSLRAWVPPARTLMVVTAESEVVRFQVANPVQATFQTAGLRLYGEGSFDGECGVSLGEATAVEPQLGAELAYSVVEGGRLYIELSGPTDRPIGLLRTENGEVPITSDMALVSDEACTPPTIWRFPVWGPGDVGGLPGFRADGPAPTLLRGEVEVFGRSTETPLDPGGKLFQVNTSVYRIPTGSRLSTQVEGADPALQTLRGAAFWRRDEGFLEVKASTEAEEMVFSAPGGGPADRFQLSLVERILNDPNLRSILDLLVVLAVLMPIALEIVKPIGLRD